MDMKHSDAIVYYDNGWDKVANKGENSKNSTEMETRKFPRFLENWNWRFRAVRTTCVKGKEPFERPLQRSKKKEQRMAVCLTLLTFEMERWRSKWSIACRYPSTIFSCTTYAKDVVDTNIQKDLLTFQTPLSHLTHKRKLYMPVLPPLISGTESHKKNSRGRKWKKCKKRPRRQNVVVA